MVFEDRGHPLFIPARCVAEGHVFLVRNPNYERGPELYSTVQNVGLGSCPICQSELRAPGYSVGGTGQAVHSGWARWFVDELTEMGVDFGRLARQLGIPVEPRTPRGTATRESAEAAAEPEPEAETRAETAPKPDPQSGEETAGEAGAAGPKKEDVAWIAPDGSNYIRPGPLMNKLRSFKPVTTNQALLLVTITLTAWGLIRSDGDTVTHEELREAIDEATSRAAEKLTELHYIYIVPPGAEFMPSIHPAAATVQVNPNGSVAISLAGEEMIGEVQSMDDPESTAMDHSQQGLLRQYEKPQVTLGDQPPPMLRPAPSEGPPKPPSD